MQASGSTWTMETTGWIRGPARTEGGFIVLPLRDAERHPPTKADADSVLFDLAAIRRPREAIAFVGRYGMLLSPTLEHDQLETLRTAKGEPQFRESFIEWEREARELDAILRAYALVRRADSGQDDAPAAFEHLRSHWRTIMGPGHSTPDDALLTTVDRWIAETVSVSSAVRAWVLAETDPRMGGRQGRHGRFIMSVLAPTIRDFARGTLMLLVSSGEPVSSCAEAGCGRSYRKLDARQKYCTATCANRVRNRNWLAKQKGAAS